jgi:hypothetical protein
MLSKRVVKVLGVHIPDVDTPRHLAAFLLPGDGLLAGGLLSSGQGEGGPPELGDELTGGRQPHDDRVTGLDAELLLSRLPGAREIDAALVSGGGAGRSGRHP